MVSINICGFVDFHNLLDKQCVFQDKIMPINDELDEKIVIGKIDYINASPVYYGLDNGLMPDWLKMVEGPPAVLNGMIKNSQLAISPVSAAFYGMNHNDFLVLPDLSISCHGRVLSVILMSNFPIDQLDGKNIILTEDSATGAALVKLMAYERGIDPVFSQKKIRSLEEIPDYADAALIIGDAALTLPWEYRFRYRMDLGDMWFNETRLPFVFALWVVRRSYALDHRKQVQKVVDLFHASRKAGYDNLNKIIESGADKLRIDVSKVKEYYDLLFCDLDVKKIQALELFFNSLYKFKIFSNMVDIQFF